MEPSLVTLHVGDSQAVLLDYAADAFDAVVCDPPYDLTSTGRTDKRVGGGGFMGNKWDGTGIAFRSDFWEGVLRVLKPGGHLLAFGGTRTYHRMACAIEDAGFEIRDSLHWVYGTGFPKSLDVSKAIDRAGGQSPRDQAAWLLQQREAAGMSREQVAEAIGCTPASVRDWELGRARETGKPVEWLVPSPEYREKLTALFGYTSDERTVTGEAKDRRGDGSVIGLGHSGTKLAGDNTAAAQKWSGWGTALKPAHEPIILARKPLAEGTVAANVLAHGVGAINIDACRLDTTPRTTHADGNHIGDRDNHSGYKIGDKGYSYPGSAGRFPANLLLTHAPGCRRTGTNPTAAGEKEDWLCVENCPVRSLDQQSGTQDGGHPVDNMTSNQHAGIRLQNSEARHQFNYGDAGGASRFFACFEPDPDPMFYCPKASRSERDAKGKVRNTHPTVKPLKLMTYLVQLVTPPGGRVLDPFVGSGSTALACAGLGLHCVGIDQSEEYVGVARARLAAA